MESTILTNRNFYGKMLLIGEHSVIDGSKALVVPYREITACLAFGSKPLKGEEIESNRLLFEFATWMKEKQDASLPELNIARLLLDIAQGMFLQSNIPVGYGLGSSGALCAAVYEEYGSDKFKTGEDEDPESLLALKKRLAAMESWFHGTSSGIDPLCIYCNKAFVLGGKDKIATWHIESIRKNNLQGFLLDTGLTANTGKLVQSFRKKLQGESLKESFTEQYIPLVNEVVDQFIDGHPDYDSLVQLSLFQWRIFHEMIPDKFWRVWEYGFDWEYYTCKLLGSGGGGYILGFTEDFEYASHCLRERFGLEAIPIKLW